MTLNLQNSYAPLVWSRDPWTSRHRVVINTVWDIPVGRGKRALSNMPPLLNQIVGVWHLSWIAIMQTGQFFSPSFSGSDPSNTNTSGGLPERIANGSLPFAQRTISHWFDTGAFAVPQKGSFGNSGEDILEGPGLYSHNATFSKRFPIRERMAFTFTLAVFNVMNHPNFALPSANISVPATAGVISSTNAVAGARAMELRLRLGF